MDIVALRRQGWTIGQIADAIGCHPATVSSWLKKGGPPAKRGAPAGHEPAISEHWSGRVSQLFEANPEVLATSIERILRAECFTGSYPTLVRHLREVRGVRRRRPVAVSVPIETAPGAGVPVRLVRLLRLGGGLGARRPPLLRCGAVLVTQPAPVVRAVGRPGARLRGPGAVLRGGGRRGRRRPHRPHGGARDLKGRHLPRRLPGADGPHTPMTLRMPPQRRS